MGLTKFRRDFVDKTRTRPDLFQLAAVHGLASVLAPQTASRHDLRHSFKMTGAELIFNSIPVEIRTQNAFGKCERIMSRQNLETYFDSQLREVPVDPDSFLRAISSLKSEINPSFKNSDTVKKLGLLGSYLRIMGSLDEAEAQLTLAISMASELNQPTLKLANLIRLGHVIHWKNNFARAHQIFDEGLKLITQNQDLSSYLDFVYQHKGKCHFDEGKFESALEHFHKALLIRNTKAEAGIDLVDSTLQAVEEVKKRWLPQVPSSMLHSVLSFENLPPYVQQVLGKRHGKELPSARLNCINGALNFHGIEVERMMPFRPIEMLEFLNSRTVQVLGADDFHFGDFVIWWNRSDAKWSHRKILIEDMKIDDPDFPYGLVFDHVAIRLTPEIVFHKPNPSPSSEYRLDFLETASYPSKLGHGNEMTFHRKVS